MVRCNKPLICSQNYGKSVNVKHSKHSKQMVLVQQNKLGQLEQMSKFESLELLHYATNIESQKLSFLFCHFAPFATHT